MNEFIEDIAQDTAESISSYYSYSELASVRRGNFSAVVKVQIMDTIQQKIYQRVLEILVERENQE